MEMKWILRTRILPATLTASVIALLLFRPEGNEVWLQLAVGLLILDGLVFVWRRLRKPRNIAITAEEVTVGGLTIDRRDIRAWRIFRAAYHGEPGRYIELELERVPLSPLGWKLAKFFEELPSPQRDHRGIPLAKEPRIIARLGSADLPTGEIEAELNRKLPPTTGDLDRRETLS